MEEHEARRFEEEEEEEEEMEEVVAAPVQYRNAARHEHQTVQEVLESADAEQERDVESESDGEALWKRLGVEKVAEQVCCDSSSVQEVLMVLGSSSPRARRSTRGYWKRRKCMMWMPRVRLTRRWRKKCGTRYKVCPRTTIRRSEG